MDEITIQTYNQLAKEYDQEVAYFWDIFPLSFITDFVSAVGKPNRILNIGSGPGRDGSLLYAAGLNVTCLDASAEMVTLSKQRGLFSVLGDFFNLPFENNSFAGIWAYTALLHCRKSELPKALKEVNRVLKKDGILGLGMVLGEGEGYRESSEIKSPRWFAYYSLDELKNILLAANFEIISSDEFKPKSKTYLNILVRKRG